MTVSERLGPLDRPTLLEKLIEGGSITRPEPPEDLRGYVEMALQSGFSAAGAQLSLRGRARDEIGDDFISGVVLHTGPNVFELDHSIVAAPIAALWR